MYSLYFYRINTFFIAIYDCHIDNTIIAVLPYYWQCHSSTRTSLQIWSQCRHRRTERTIDQQDVELIVPVNGASNSTEALDRYFEDELIAEVCVALPRHGSQLLTRPACHRGASASYASTTRCLPSQGVRMF